jgi:anaerobic dimethyl sulfoxide reductase subunit A
LEKDLKKNKKNKIITTTCGYDCGGRCLLEVEVINNKVQSIKSGNTGILHIKACSRGIAQKEMVHSPDRLDRPLKRIGKRGNGNFIAVSWDEALDIISSKLEKAKKEYGSESIYFIPGSGALNALNNVRSVTKRFFSMLGKCTTVWGGQSLEGALQSSLATFGTEYTGSTRDNLLYSKLIILWGWNPKITRYGSDTYYYLAKAKNSGVEIISVDPRKNHSTESLADHWIQIRPGTDTAMLAAMAQVLIDEEIYDADFIQKYTSGFENYKNYLTGKEDKKIKNPVWASNICGVAEETIKDIARKYAKIKPAALITGWAPGRTAYGEQFHRAASILAAMTGNIGNKGGFVSGGADIIDSGKIANGVPVPDINHNMVHNTELYDSLIHGKRGGYPSDCKILYIVGSNLLNQYLNINKGRKAMMMPEFIVVHDLFLTNTSRFADVILPIKHFLEREDIGTPWIGGPYLISMNNAVKPSQGLKSDLEIFTGIAKKMGINSYNNKTDREWLKEMLDSKKDFSNFKKFKEKDILIIEKEIPKIAFKKEIENPEKYPFPTPSGKIEIFSKRFDDMKNPLLPPIPKYIDSTKKYNGKYPIQLVTTHSKARINSQLYNISPINKSSEDFLWINPQDAAKRNIKDGNLLYVFNKNGRIVIRAKVTDKIMQGVVSLDEGIWHNPDKKGICKSGSVNVLTSDIMSPAGAFVTNSSYVQIEKI